MQDESLYKIALSMVPQVGPVNARVLVGYCGGVEAVFKESKKALLKINGIGETVANHIKDPDIFDQAQQQQDFLDKNNARALFFLDTDYPERLKKLKDAPILLYYKGNGDLNLPRTLGVIGTRKPSPEGKATTEAIVSGLQKYQVQVVSGLAYGIDITAHRSCVAHDISTIGVMGTGLDKLYPANHYNTAQAMCELGGLLTEFPINCLPDAVHFPMRNRIIAGLSDGILVVESALKGGSIITAEMGIAYHKELFAIPGRIQDTYARGCNALIKSQKAQLIEDVDELATFMNWNESSWNQSTQTSLFVELDEQERAVTEILTSDSEVSIDKIYTKLNWPPSKVASVLLNLEFKGVVRCLPGKRYILAH